MKMKKLLLILLCLPMIGFGQVTTPSVVSSSGDSYNNGTCGNPIIRPKGSVSTTSKLIREHISQAIDGNKIIE